MRNVWNGEYHSRSQCVCGTIATVIGCVSGMRDNVIPHRNRVRQNRLRFRAQAVHTTGAIRKSDGLTFLAVRSASPGHLGGVLILEGALKKYLRRGSLVAGLAGITRRGRERVRPSRRTARPALRRLVDPVNADIGVGLNLLWVVIGAVLVVFMQAGFALVETGFTAEKHAAHVMTTNFAIFGLGFVGFFFIGFPLVFGGFSYPGYSGSTQPVGDALIGSGNWVFLWQGGWALTDLGDRGAARRRSRRSSSTWSRSWTRRRRSRPAPWPSGGSGRRSSAGACSAARSTTRCSAAWTWGGGWLAKLGNSAELGFGYVDFAGSGVVHAVGGVAALAGAIVLGPRIGKYGPDGKPRAMPAHNIPMAHARHVHPAVRLVRLQRRVDLRGDRRALRRRRGEHRDRGRVRCDGRDVLRHAADRASPTRA